MTIRKRATTSRGWDQAYSYDERERSLSSTISDADSSAIHYPHAIVTLKRGRESVENGLAILEMLRGISVVSPDYYNRVRNEEIFREAAWTDQKHRSYLSLMEAEFVRSLHHQNHRAFCLADSDVEDCVESHTTSFNASSELEEIPLVKSVLALTPRTSSLSISKSDLETDSSISSCSVCVDAGFQRNNTKERTSEFEHEGIDLELRLSDLATRLFKQQDMNLMLDSKFSKRI